MSRFAAFFYSCFTLLLFGCLCEQGYDSDILGKESGRNESDVEKSAYRRVFDSDSKVVLEIFSNESCRLGFAHVAFVSVAFPVRGYHVREYAHLKQWECTGILVTLATTSSMGKNRFHVLYVFKKGSEVPECVAIYKFIEDKWVAQDVPSIPTTPVTTPGSPEKEKEKS